MKLRALQLSLVGLVASALVFALSTSGNGQEAPKSASPDKPKKVVKTDAEWRKLLTKEQYMVTRHAYTEPAFSGKLVNNHAKGVYECICCETELFSSKTKFDSGTGWPSFYAPYDKKNLDTHPDPDGSNRVEVNCSVCDAHLGHVFDDAPATPTGLRFCMNSASLKFVKDTPPAKTTAKGKTGKTTEKAEKTETEKKDEKTEKVEKKDAPATESPK
jgi:peptide-methionine (R)-S-oxide reductase